MRNFCICRASGGVFGLVAAILVSCALTSPAAAQAPQACCFSFDGACADLLPGLCTFAGGIPQGAGTSCAGVQCQCGDGGDCCTSNGTPGCDDPACCDAVCGIDPFCCATAWDGLCAAEAQGLCDVCQAGPPNDNCGDRFDIFNGTTGFSNLGANTDGPAPCGALGSDIWYNYVAAFDGTLTVDTIGSAFDTVLAAYDGCGCPVGPNLACNDDAIGLQSSITFVVSAGNCYKIQVGGFGAAQGSGVINITKGTICPNDGSCFEPHPTVGCDDEACCNAVCAQDAFCCDTEWDSICVGAAVAKCVCPGDGNCFEAHGGLGCNDAACCSAVCAQDSFCCTTKWDSICADEAQAKCGNAACAPGSGPCNIGNGTPGCDDPVCCKKVCLADPFCCDTEWDDICAEAAIAKGCALPLCPGSGNCFDAHGGLGCADLVCCALVCDQDPFCCAVEWDGACADLALDKCGDAACNKGAGPCNVPHGTPGCAQAVCCKKICLVDPFCCDVAWDLQCVLAAKEKGCLDVLNDNCSQAFPIFNGSTDFSTHGATTDGPDDCAFISQDIWYHHQATFNGKLLVDTFGSEFDTVLVVYDGCGCPPGFQLACNDDAGFGVQSQVVFEVQAGQCYTIRVGGFNGDQGLGTINISKLPECVCPPGSLSEPEPCGADTNGGCNSAPPAFTAAKCGQTWCGTAWAEEGVRDTDWYRVSIVNTTTIVASLVSEFDGVVFIVAGLDTCIPAIIGIGEAGGCGPGLPASALVSPGDYAVFVATDGFDGVPCPSKNLYWVNIFCDQVCPAPGDCLEVHFTPGCEVKRCCDDVCAIDPFCCNVAWDGKCVELAYSVCLPAPAFCPGPGSCFEANGSPSCNLETCCSLLCIIDTYCCNVEWDQDCADAALKFCKVDCPGGGGDCCVANGSPGCDDVECCTAVCQQDIFCCEVTWDAICAAEAATLCAALCSGPPSPCPGTGACCKANGTPGCEDVTCCQIVCSIDPFCCDVAWDSICADEANALCVDECGAPGEDCCLGDETPEPEACGLDLNGGCNSTPPVFVTAGCGTSWCGTAWADGGTRDTDWYQVSANAGELSATLTSEFAGVVFIISNLCSNPQVIAAASSSGCRPATATATVVTGQYAVFVATAGFDGVPCGTSNEYRVDVACGQPASACGADANNDGQINVVDLLVVYSEFGCVGACAGDVTGDNLVSVLDIVAVLLNWGPCP